MYIRCPECQTATWIETIVPDEVNPFVVCKECGDQLLLMAAGELGTTSEEQHRRALQYAEFNQIDLPSAYSVLLGLMPLERARQARDEGTGRATPSPPPERPLVAAAPALEPEPQLAPGVETDLEPSVATAHSLSTGQRRVLAAKLARRHGLSMRLAHLVADGRLSLHSATRTMAGERVVDPGSAPVTRSQARVFGALAAVVLIAVVAFGWGRWKAYERRVAAADETLSAAAMAARIEAAEPESTAEPAAPAARPSVEVRTDHEGRIVEVLGPNPQSVLLAFCENNEAADRIEAVALAEAVPPFPGKRLGVFRDFHELDKLYSIEIRRDRELSRWIAGNGEEPIAPAVTRNVPPDAHRLNASR